jgi:hypothetical protein
MKYHPGKVLKIFSPKDKSIVAADTSTQALVEMWDENVLTVKVDLKVAPKLKTDDYVLIDYNPVSASSAVPKVIITKIIRGELAKSMWKKYKNFLEKKKKMLKQRVRTVESSAIPTRSYG